MSEWKWALLAVVLLIIYLLLSGAVAVRAQGGAWVHGIVQDDAYQPVYGGTVYIEHYSESDGFWYIEFLEIERQPHAFQWNLTKPGRYQVKWEKPGYVINKDRGIRYGKFTLPDGAPFGDIVINVRRVASPTATPPPTPTLTPQATYTNPPPPTTLYPPTVDPTATAPTTTTPAPCLEFQQFSWLQRRAVIDNAVLPHNRRLEDKLDWDTDPTLIFGLRDQLLGMPGSRRFEVTADGVTLTARAFCNGILTMRPVLREECMSYGVITWDGSQDWDKE